MTSTDLVPVNGDLAEAEAERLAGAIAELGERGDAAKLKEVAGEIDARVAYFRRQQLDDAIRRGVWLRILTEAEMGEILLRGEWPDDVMIKAGEMTNWRALAIGRKRGALESAVREGLEKGQLSTLYAVSRLRSTGALFVPNGALRDAFASTDYNVAELARRAGVRYNQAAACVGTASGGPSRCGWEYAARVASALGVPPTSLPRAKPNRPPVRRQWLHRTRKLTGGRWDESYVRFRGALDEFAKVAGEASQWSEAYDHWYALERTISLAMKHDALNG